MVRRILFLLLLACSCHALRAELPPDILELPPFERAVTVIKHFEGWHSARHHPYVGYGHRISAGEKLTAAITETQADSLLRRDLSKMCALFRHLGKDSLLVGCLAYQVGPYRLLGYGKMPKSTLVRKLEAGDRDIYKDFVAYRCYKGKPVASIERRRKKEFELLFIP